MLTDTGIHDGPLPESALSAAPLRCREHGAVASFVGVVRDEHLGKGVTHLIYECYREMAEPMLQRLVDEARADHDPGLQAIVVHGTGRMDPGEASVAIHVSSAHRVAAFDACRQLIERIKQDLPVWKREFYADGSDAWLKGS